MKSPTYGRQLVAQFQESQTALIPAARDQLPVHDSLGESLAQIRQAATVANTERAFDGGLRYWREWHRLRFGAELLMPVPSNTVAAFITDHTYRPWNGTLRYDLPESVDCALIEMGLKRRPGPLRLNTMRHRVSILSMWHQREGSPFNPCKEPAIAKLLKDVAHVAAKAEDIPKARPSAALTGDLLERLLGTCDDSLVGRRDRALLLLGWSSGGRRRSEIASATVEQLTEIPNGYLFELRTTKTRKTLEDNGQAPIGKPVVGSAGAALREWLAAANITRGPLFRMARGNRVYEAALSAQSIYAMMRKRAKLAGLEGRYTPHSLRSGFVTQAGRSGIPPGDAMALSDHVSVQTFFKYYRAGKTENTAAAYLYDLPNLSRRDVESVQPDNAGIPIK